MAAGTRTFRFRAASAGSCNGTTLAQTTIILADDDDYTLIGTAKAPLRVVVFDNTPVPLGNINFNYFRNGSDLGSLTFSYETQTFVPSVLPDEFEKGQGGDVSFGASSEPLLVAAFRANATDAIAGPGQYQTLEGRRHEFIAIGTNKGNARFAVVVRPTIPL